jgi:hypothetical protein
VIDATRKKKEIQNNTKLLFFGSVSGCTCLILESKLSVTYYVLIYQGVLNFFLCVYMHRRRLHKYDQSLLRVVVPYTLSNLCQRLYALVATSADSVPSSNLVRITIAPIGTTFGNLQ